MAFWKATWWLLLAAAKKALYFSGVVPSVRLALMAFSSVLSRGHIRPPPPPTRARLCRPAAVAVRLPFWQRTRMLTLYDSDEFRMNFSEYLSKRTRPGVSGCAFAPDLIS